MEQEMMEFWRESGGMPVPPVDAYGNMPMSQNCFALLQFKYDAESDGYYFEMPSVDGWKKRQPNSNSSSSVSSSGSLSKCGTAFTHGPFVHLDETQSLSYGAALARGQLPAACMMAPNFSYLPEPFSSDASSMTTLSEGAPTPPPHGFCGMNGLPEQDGIDSILAEQYDNVLKLEDAFSSTMTGLDSNENSSLIRPQESQQFLSDESSKKQPISYADVAAASCNAKEEKDKLDHEDHHLGNLQLSVSSNLSEDSEEDENVNEHDSLLNFTDKSISHLLSCCPNPQRFKRDLAALKTPVAASSQMFSLDVLSPDPFDIRSAWSTLDEDGKCDAPENTWSTNNLENDCSNFNGDIWALSGSLDYQPPGKSKLSIWCNNNLLTSTLIDK